MILTVVWGAGRTGGRSEKPGGRRLGSACNSDGALARVWEAWGNIAAKVISAIWTHFDAALTLRKRREWLTKKENSPVVTAGKFSLCFGNRPVRKPRQFVSRKGAV